MTDGNSGPPAQKVTKDEIVAAITEICEKKGVPVVRTKDIVELDAIDAGSQAVNKHLDELVEMGRVNHLEYGSKGVWWVPEDEEAAGEVDISAVDWDSIDPEEIPDEVLEEHPEFQDPTYWQSVRDEWATVAVNAFFIMFAGFWIELLRQYQFVQLGQTLQNLILLVILGGFGIGVLGLLVVMGAITGQQLEDAGVFPAVRTRLHTLKLKILRRVGERIPDIEESQRTD